MMQESLFKASWRYLYEDAPILFLHLDSDGAVRDANAFTRKRILGIPEKKTVQEIFLSFAGPIDYEALRREPERSHRLHAATAEGIPETFRVRFFPCGDGTLAFGSMDADEAGSLRQELIVLNNRLNALTRELQKKNHELEELNRLKNQFLGMAAHDLRKPVSAILHYSEFLIDEAEDALDEEHFGFLKTIHASTDLMRRVIDDFLDISMIELGRFDLERSPADIMEPIHRSVALNRLPAGKRDISLRITSNGEFDGLMMDSVKIEQVLNNLISNAIEHSPPHSEVGIRVSKTGGKATIEVKDAGPGVPLKERETLFQPFVRGSAKKGPGVKSTGLGLAISRKIVEAHGGKIWVEEGQTGGSVFAFCLPMTEMEMENGK